jgi:3',5'-cyclic AMP phosphodiesterase CpdA
MDIWRSFNGPSYHVIGNHDTDDVIEMKRNVYTRDEVASFWGMPGPYYSFDIKGWHFIVLYGSDEVLPGIRGDGYPRYIGKKQRLWLMDDLEKTKLPVILFCHQGADLDTDAGLIEGTYIRRILEKANEKAGWNKARLVLSGHHHRDYHNNFNNIHYVQINSMSYQWLGEQFSLERYEPALHEKYPILKFLAPYKDPLWALITIENDGSFNIKGKESSWVGPSPLEMGYDFNYEPYPSVPYISNRKIKW